MTRTIQRRWLSIAVLLVLLCVPVFSGDTKGQDVRTYLDIDTGWKFLKADAPGAEQPRFDDRAWRTVDVPHDWSIEGPFAETNRTGGAGGFLPSGIGWYRKHFSLAGRFSNQAVSVELDGVMANCDVWINGFHLGHRPNGYVSFRYELTGHLSFGSGDNVLAVRADTSNQPASRWYTGAGIYRHVRLVICNPIHITPWSVFVTTPQVSSGQAMVRIRVAVVNESTAPAEVFLRLSVLDPRGKIVGAAETRPQAASGSAAAQFEQDIVVEHPHRWNLAQPELYRAQVRVICSGRPLDDDSVAFGIREFRFDPETGFWLNGRNFKIKGVCLHHDGGAFGAAVPLGVWEERLNTLKALGVNAVRTAHNPPAPEFLDLCDRLGLLVMDEFFDCWTAAKNPYDYHLYFSEWSQRDERDTILRDRNHPSIILYSVGNEIRDTPKAELAKDILRRLVETAHEADPTRPVTQALFRPNVSHDYDNGLADLLDVVGQNYRENEILAAHRQKRSRRIIGTENQHGRTVWLALRDNPPYAGQFLWSGIDYLGESRRWPVVAAGSGLLDRTGAPKPMAFERQSWWSDQPMVFLTRRVAPNAAGATDPGYEPAQQDPLRRPQVLFDDWTPGNSQPHDETVEVYSNCEQVELFLNGKSLGTKPLPADASPRVWQVPWAAGTLKAIARNKGNVVATSELRTAGKPARVSLDAGRGRLQAGWNSVAYVRATVVDERGIPDRDADGLISFKISGPGVIAAVDNADNASHEPFQAHERHSYQGRCVAFVQAIARSGKIVLTASSPGLKSASVTLRISDGD